jgi:hypothetical protein
MAYGFSASGCDAWPAEMHFTCIPNAYARRGRAAGCAPESRYIPHGVRASKSQRIRPAHPYRLRPMRKAGREAQPSPLRGVHAAGAQGAWPTSDRMRAPGATSPNTRGQRPSRRRRDEPQAGRGDRRAARRSREWKRDNPNGAGHDRAWFLREVTPKLDDVPLSAIARATGLSLAACSRYRAGARVPHPRHWGALAAFARGR